MSIEVPVILIVIAIIFFFSTAWVLKKYSQNIKKNKITAIILSIIITPLAYYGLILLLSLFLFFNFIL